LLPRRLIGPVWRSLVGGPFHPRACYERFGGTLAGKYVDKDIIFGIRPENINNEPREGSSTPVTLTVDIAEPMGSFGVDCVSEAGTGNLIARIPGEHLFHLGEQVTVQLDLVNVALFQPETEQVIR
jgi:multiple sugar transport system ATP-binding protein